MRRHGLAIAAAMLCLGAAPLSPTDIVAQAPASDWRTLDPANLLVMRLASGTAVIELAPDFAPRTIANVRRFAHEHYFDGGWIVPERDPGALAKLLEQVAADATLRGVRGAAARRNVEARFTYEAVSQALASACFAAAGRGQP